MQSRITAKKAGVINKAARKVPTQCNDIVTTGSISVPHLDLEIRGGGHPEGGSSLKKKFFWPFGPQFGLKIRAGEAGPPGPLPWNAWIRHCNVRHPNFNDFSRYKLRTKIFKY